MSEAGGPLCCCTAVSDEGPPPRGEGRGKSLIHLILHSQSHPSDALSRLLYLWNRLTYPTDLLQAPMKILQSTSLILPYSLCTLYSVTLHFRQCLFQIIFLIQYSILQPC